MAQHIHYTIRVRRDGYWPNDEDDPACGFETYTCTVMRFADVRIAADELPSAALLGMGGAEFGRALERPDFVVWPLHDRAALPDEPTTAARVVCLCSTATLTDVDFDADPVVLPENAPGWRGLLEKVAVETVPDRN